MRVFKRCPTGHRHLWFTKYCYHKSYGRCGTAWDDFVSITFHTWNFRKDRYVSRTVKYGETIEEDETWRAD